VGKQSRVLGTNFQFPLSSRDLYASIRYGKILHVNYSLHVKFHLSYLLVPNPVLVLPITLVGDT
jgi:hypothetical protein